MAVVLLNIDCMQYMAGLPDKSFDLAIVDPPYFEDYGKEIFPGAEISTTGVMRNRFESKQWNIPSEEYFKQLIRVSKEQIIWGFNYYSIKNISSGRIIWDKKNDTSSFSKAEIAYCSKHNSVQIFRYTWNGMIQENMRQKERRIHPTQKPVALYRWLLENYAEKGQRILDTHLGSGSSAIAAHYFGCDFVGCEIDGHYYRAAKERFEKQTSQKSLFMGVENG